MTDQAKLERGYRRPLAWYPRTFRQQNGGAALAPGLQRVLQAAGLRAGDVSKTNVARAASDKPPDQRCDHPVSDRETPLFTGVNGTLMARPCRGRPASTRCPEPSFPTVATLGHHITELSQ
jgi:hypothetical protein